MFKLFLATNHKPNVRGTDHAIWRRVRFLPFTDTIPEAEQERGLREKLLDERAGILNWMLAGCLDWQAHGHIPPETVQEATRAYQHEQDALHFLDEECVTTNPSAKVAVAQFYKAFTDWAEENHEYVPSQRKLGEALIEKGYTRTREYFSGKTQYVWYGVGLISTSPSPDHHPCGTDVISEGGNVTSEASRPGSNCSHKAQQAGGTDVTDVKVSKVKNFVPHVEDFLEITSVTSETSELEASARSNASLLQPFSDVTFPDEVPGAKRRAFEKHWPVDPPTTQDLRVQALLECLCEAHRDWNVCLEAARAYVAAGEPSHMTDFWRRGPEPHKNLPLWNLIGQALAGGGAPGAAAIDLLNRIRSHA